MVNEPVNEAGAGRTAGAVRARSVRIRRFVTLLAVASATLVLLERFSAASIALAAGGWTREGWLRLACQAVSAVPEALFVLGLWWVRDALAAFSRGELFAPPVTRMLDRVGLVLFCGSAMRILLVPGLCRLLGVNAGYWIAFDPAGMVLGAMGLALKAIAGVLRHAAAIQTELDEMF